MTNDWRCWWMGSDLGTSWRQPIFHDTSWPTYVAPLTNGTAALPVPGQTWLSLTNPSGQPITTYYLRASFALATDPADLLSLDATLLADDGTVIYLNGAEVARYNLPTGAITAATLALNDVDATNLVLLSFDRAAFVPGSNVLAVELHQSSANSGDVAFGLSLAAQVRSPTALSITQDVTSVTVTSGWPALLSVGVAGSLPRYQWFKDGQALPGATGTTVNFPMTKLTDAGLYQVVMTNSLGAVTSAVATLAVVIPTNAPATQDRIGTNALATDGLPGAAMSWDAAAGGAWGACGSVFTPAVSGTAREFSFVFFGRYHNLDGTNSGPLTSFEDFQMELRVWTNGPAAFLANPWQPDVALALGIGPTNPPAWGATTNLGNGQVFPTFRKTLDLSASGLRLAAGQACVVAPVFVKRDATRLVRLSLSREAGPADLYAGWNSGTNTTTGAGFAFTRYATALTVSAEVPVVVLGIAPFGSNFALSWPALSGQSGQPEMWATTNLATGPWLPFTGPLATNFLVVTNATGQQFFRLKFGQ